MSNGRYKGPRRGPVEPTKSSQAATYAAKQRALVHPQNVPRRTNISTPGWTPYSREEVEAAVRANTAPHMDFEPTLRAYAEFEGACRDLGIKPVAQHAPMRSRSEVINAILWELR